MPEHTKAEKAKKSETRDSSIGGVLRKLLPGGLASSMLGDVNKKLKGATDKKKKK